ncbi:MAG: hypothetical protein DRI40_04850 [Chloroflexi bacterium]|nr:MAG: hypothetical protein DRI40_04850 [Chloroflexota bacterium]
MSQELGRMEKPSANEFKAERKLFFVPLVFLPRKPEGDLQDRVSSYWEQVEAHVTNLESKLGNVKKVYHELVPVGGENGAKAIEELNTGSHSIVQARLATGAELQPLEEAELLAEFMDWSRCLAVGLQSQKAIRLVYDSYLDAQKRRDEHMAKCIDETLGAREVGLLLMREGHGVQFPSDVQVFYVAPPALDELKRWLRDRQAESQSASDQASGEPD